ncbi:DUF1501 domain-containing protein [Verrucomicrobium spinosum]|uniref:DUF1501 domain-containing protein n=1 Tax=Verrucomicrobium spinosum TaxID=2736 RepID=UPI000A68518E
MDLFDPKPALAARNGQPLPFAKPKLERTKTGNLLGSPWQFKSHGQSGTEISELMPHLATCADDLCVVRSMVADNINHNGACLQMNTGEQAFSRPSMLLAPLRPGLRERQLPGYVVISLPNRPVPRSGPAASSPHPSRHLGSRPHPPRGQPGKCEDVLRRPACPVGFPHGAEPPA